MHTTMPGPALARLAEAAGTGTPPSRSVRLLTAGRITAGRLTLYRLDEAGTRIALTPEEVTALLAQPRPRRRCRAVAEPTAVARLLGHDSGAPPGAEQTVLPMP
ncbi:hypothetical protein [Streptomyces sp. NPDC001889]